MHNYHQVKLWHEEYDSKSAASRGDRVEDAELAFNRNYVHQKLEHGLLRVWRVRSGRCEEWTFVCADVAIYLCNYSRQMHIPGKLLYQRSTCLYCWTAALSWLM